MVDICLELPDSLIEVFERRAAAQGRLAEDLMREAIEAAAPTDGKSFIGPLEPLDDEPIVKAADIEKAYRSLGYQYGWRFATCPWEQASAAKLILVTLNPAGREAHGPGWSQELGSAYRVESWNGQPPGRSLLQQQVQRLFSFLDLADEAVFSAHYVPFRSPTWSELDQKAEAERFALELWRWLRPKLTQFERIICVGKNRPGKPIAALFDAKHEASLRVGWGDVTADRYRLADGRPLIALPHLSRFALFGRSTGEDCLRRLFEL